MQNKKGKIAVLLSGRGSNFAAIYRNSIEKGSRFLISVVISDKKNAPGLKTAAEAGIPALFINPSGFPSKKDYEKELAAIFELYEVDLICLAGFMRIISPFLISRYRNRIINIHPSLLPSFPGLDAQKQALDAGVSQSGCTVHFVNEGVDSGPVIMHRKVPVEKDDNVETLSARILEQEHLAYSRVIDLFFRGKLKIEGKKVKIIP